MPVIECKPRFAPQHYQLRYRYYLLQSLSTGKQSKQYRRDGRVVEGARLESVYTATYRGFEPLSLRHLTY